VLQKIHTSEKFSSSITASTMTLLQEPTPLPLPSFGKMSLDEAEQQQQGRSNNKKQPLITTAAVIGAAAAATDAHVIVDNSSQEKEHKWELSPPLAAAARDVESIISNGSNHAKQSASELVLHQEQDESSSADPTVTKIEQAFARGSLVCESSSFLKVHSTCCLSVCWSINLSVSHCLFVCFFSQLVRVAGTYGN
jgi:hypothetical protein